MASVLENLASHYNGMATALKETEIGEVFNEEDWQGTRYYLNNLQCTLTVASHVQGHRRTARRCRRAGGKRARCAWISVRATAFLASAR